MKGRGSLTIPTHRLDVTEKGAGLLDDLDLDASFHDYGRADKPTLTAMLGEEQVFSFEFASPDEARQLGERLFALARKTEEKTGQRGPEYRAKLARDEATTVMRDLVARLETAMNIPPPNDGLTIMRTKFGAAIPSP